MGSASYEVSREMRYTIGLQGIPSSNICMGENCLKNSLPVVLAYWKANAASQCANKLQALNVEPTSQQAQARPALGGGGQWKHFSVGD